jgi:hypothetical protein
VTAEEELTDRCDCGQPALPGRWCDDCFQERWDRMDWSWMDEDEEAS